MSLLDAVRYRLRSVFRSGAASRERDEEYAFHRTLTARDEATNAPADEAAWAARRAFGNTTYVKEEVRRLGAMRWIDVTMQDARFAIRTLRRSPIFTAVAVASLALGIGANAATFGMIDTLLLARLPVAHAEELRLVTHSRQGPTRGLFSAAEEAAFHAAHVPNFASIRRNGTPIADANGTDLGPATVDAVDGAFFGIVVPPIEAGRLITPADVDNNAFVTVLSYAFARTVFADPDAAIGKTIKMGGNSLTVVGVTGAGYGGLWLGTETQATIPATLDPVLDGHPAGSPQSQTFLVTRMRADSMRVRAALAADFAACCAARQLAMPQLPRDARPAIRFVDISRGATEGKMNARQQFRDVLLALMAGVAVLLLIVCTNLGNLLLARAAARTRELSIRLSLGASRGRIVIQLLVESLVLALTGALGGLVLALWASTAVVRHLPAGLVPIRPFVTLRPSATILWFTAAIAVGCAMIFGVTPALRATRGDLVTRLRDAARASQQTRAIDRIIVAVQVALALLLVTSATLLSTTLRHLAGSVAGSDPQTLVVVQLQARGTHYSEHDLETGAGILEGRFRSLPGVRSVARTNAVPLIYGGLPTLALDVPGYEGQSDEDVTVAALRVTPAYRATLGIHRLVGRDIDSSDVTGAPKVAMVSENLARHFFTGRNPIGRMIGIRGTSRDIRIIGVVADGKQTDLRADAPLTIYLPGAQFPEENDRAVFAIRTVGDPAPVISSIRATIGAELPGIRIRDAEPMTEILWSALGREKVLASLAAGFGALAVLLAMIGLYGVVAFQVVARTREIGVRMALGAGQGRVVRMVLRESLAVIAAGLALGVPVALAGAQSLRALLYGVTPLDPMPIAFAAAVLVIAGVAATLIPARNAAHVDPLVAIRAE